jgi:serine/threonine protein kinase/formylglycine-generating enzyme required for sulfatase activity
MNADRNLLLGILALQNNFIDRHQLIAAFDRWTGNKSKSLGQFLVDQTAIDADTHVLLEALVAKHLRLHSDDPGKSLAAVTPIGSLRDELKRLADPDVEASLDHVSAQPAGENDATRSWAIGESSSAGTRFRVLRPHAQGGLGAVFVAQDDELHREVALKEIHRSRADDADSRSRFLLEAEITGGLEHPGIVPVYGLGSYADGRPFYVMRFVRGDSLKDAIVRFHFGRGQGTGKREKVRGGSSEETGVWSQEPNGAGQQGRQSNAQSTIGNSKSFASLEFRRLLGSLINVCNAIDYAHSRGVLHRDLKPPNILLGKYGETLVVDWGLAKVVGKREQHVQADEPTLQPSSSDTDVALTQMGSAIGTPQYMSPEQAQGRLDELGPATDVYGIGATLYAVLAGRSPFADVEPGEVLARAARGDFPTPRQVNRRVPPALDAICLKAMAYKPAHRYPSARALADDIEKWLADEPVTAFREPVSWRAARWTRKHRTLVGAGAAAVVVLVVGGVTAASIARHANESTRLEGLIQSLTSAEFRQLPEILAQLNEDEFRSRPLLTAKWGEAEEGSAEKLRLSLALAGIDRAHGNRTRNDPAQKDPTHVEYLFNQLLDAEPDAFPVIRDVLGRHKEAITERLWKALRGRAADPRTRLRAAGALADYDPENAEWSNVARDVATELVAVNPAFIGPWQDALRPVARVLVEPLTQVFIDVKQPELPRSLATAVLADYAKNDATKLTSLLIDADAAAFPILFPVLAKQPSDAARQVLVSQANTMPTAELPPAERMAFGRRRAGAAIVLMRQAVHGAALAALRVTDDPESLTQFVHGCRARGVTPAELIACLKVADQSRRDKTGEARRIEDRVVYGLLLAMGEFDAVDFGVADHGVLIEQLADWYAHDPSSAIHGAAGWLLRHWNQDAIVTGVDHTPLAYSSDREWFVMEFEDGGHETGGLSEFRSTADTEKSRDESPHSKFHITFVVFPAGEFAVGSPDGEAGRQPAERCHTVRLTRPFALSDREVTWEQFSACDNGGHHDAWERQFARTLPNSEPAFGVNWYDAARYCRWLTQAAGMGEEDQAYADPETVDRARFPGDPDSNALWPPMNWNSSPLNWPVDLAKPGFRLPTEHEWEVACRSGMTSAYSFGGDGQLLPHYGWFVDNVERSDNSGKWSRAVGQLRPTPRGLFDMHANLVEWCLDWMGEYGADEPLVDPLGVGQLHRVYRGGAWTVIAANCRTASRAAARPSERSFQAGFRLALVPVEKAKRQ